jgi:SAM-dependent methyltransferase
MIHFVDAVLKPYITESGYKSVCEIGASYGQTTDKILEISPLEIDIIDPCLDINLVEKYQHLKNIRVHQGISLDMLPQLSKQFDCILIDGDHNWYTVYNELRLIKEKNLLKPGGTIFFHDVYFPYGRRDMYYQPEMIPAEFRQPFAQKGIIKGQSELVDEGGINVEYYNAVHEGGPRNGVLTAIEDFVEESKGNVLFYHLIDEHGLGVLYNGTQGNAAFNRFAKRAKYLKFMSQVRGAAKKVPLVYPLLTKLYAQR